MLCGGGGGSAEATRRVAREAVAEGHQAEAAEREEREVPGELRGAGVDVVDLQQLVVDQSLDEVEQAPAAEQAADEQRARPGRVGAPPARNSRPTPMAHITQVRA
jgi:hypothetical protein